MKFDFPKAIADLVYAEWTEGRSVPGHRPPQRPPQRVLANLMDICFFASLKREEERITQFDLALCSPADLPEAAFGLSKFTRVFTVLRFDEPRKFSVNELVRLAPACNPEKTIILACYDEAGDLFLWGVVDVGWRPSVVPTCLTELRVRALGPGELRITLHGMVRCTFKDGRLSFSQRGLVNSGCIYDFFEGNGSFSTPELRSVLSRAADSSTVGDSYSYPSGGRLLILQEIIERLQQVQHGGCILVVPEGKPFHHLPQMAVKYRCRDNTVWNYLCGRSSLNDPFQKDDVENGLRDALDALVRLTAVDGAVLVTRRFELLGFGAVVQLPQNVNYKVFRSTDSYARQSMEYAVESFGTRHRSAFEFCYRGVPSVAIVASQDGEIKVMTRVGAHIFFWENTFFDY